MMPRIPHPATTNPRRWRALRQFVIRRDNYRCRACHRAGRLEVDHKVPVSQGGAWWDATGLQAICRNCHFDKSRREREKPDPERDAWKLLIKGMIGNNIACLASYWVYYSAEIHFCSSKGNPP